MSETQGASAGEQVIESARRNNADLFNALLEQYKAKPADFIKLLNSARDATGDTALHLCCKNGCYEVMDMILDFEGVDLQPTNPMSGDTPLHYACNYSFQEPDYAAFLVEQLIEVGADPAVKNKEGLKPIDIIGGSNAKIKSVLQGAEYAKNVQPEVDVVDVDDDDDDDSD